MTTKPATSFRLTAEALAALKKIAEKTGVSQAAILEILIRERAKKDGIR